MYDLSMGDRHRDGCDNNSVLNKTMKIVHIAPHCDDSGNGVVNVSVDLACLQAKSGHDVVFASPGGSFDQLLASCRVLHAQLPSVYHVTTLWKLCSLLIAIRPDIVHAHTVPGAVLAYLIRRRFSFRLITSIHNGPLIRAMLMAFGDLVIAVSDASASEMRRRGLPARKLRVVRNGPLGSPRRKASKDRPASRLRRPSIVTIAGLFSYKGIADLIEAFSLIAARQPAATLYIIGDGAERRKFERQAAKAGFADRIIFCGFVREPSAYLAEADLFVLASHREGFGLVLAEAREAGCAIVASNVGGIPEALDGGTAGVLVPPRQPGILAQVMLDLLQNDEQRQVWRSRAGENLEWLNVKRVSLETLAVYRESLSGREAGSETAPL